MANISLFQKINRSYVKPLVRRFDRYLESQEHKLTTLKAIKSYEESNSQKLQPLHKKLADEYAQDVFGSKEYAPWLYFYSLVRGEFLEGWIPDNYFGRYIAPNQGLPIVSLYKTFSKIAIKSHLLPDLAYYMNGVFYDSDFVPTTLLNIQNLNKEGYPEVFIKADNSNKGRAVSKIRIAKLREETFTRIGNCVIQAPIIQHSFFDEIIPGSVACIRIITVKNQEGKIQARTSHVNLGRLNEVVVKAENFFQIPITKESGILNPFGFTTDWKKWDYHPDTKIPFKDKQIPKYQEAVDLCIKLHCSIPHFIVIGWDIAISHDEDIYLMEWNAIYPGIKMDEAVHGPCFSGLGWEDYWKKNNR